MYGRFTEQYFNSFLPKDAPQASQSILEAWVGLMGVPRDLRQLTVVFFLKQIPEPNQRIQPTPQHGRSLGAGTLPSLRLFGAEILLCVFKGIFNTPTAREYIDDIGCGTFHIRADKIIIFFDSLRVAADRQQTDWCNIFSGSAFPFQMTFESPDLTIRQ